MSFLYSISSILSILIFYIFRYRRKVSYSNISQSFTDFSHAKIKNIQKSSYRHLTDTFFEMIKAGILSREELLSRVTIDNLDEAKKYLDNNQSIFILTAHTGTAEWAQHALKLSLDNYIDPVYKPIHSKALDHYIFDVRSRYQCSPIPYKQLAKDIVLRKNVTRCIAMLADLEPRRRDQTIEVNFLNRPTRFFLSSERIAKLAGMPVFFASLCRTERGHYKVSLKLLSDNPENLNNEVLTRSYAQCVEEVILDKPEAWLWTHKRWKNISSAN